jgi:hypothetical protein
VRMALRIAPSGSRVKGGVVPFFHSASILHPYPCRETPHEKTHSHHA